LAAAEIPVIRPSRIVVIADVPISRRVLGRRAAMDSATGRRPSVKERPKLKVNMFTT